MCYVKTNKRKGFFIMGKIAIYTRVSTNKQLDTEGGSLKVQKEKCEEIMINDYEKSREDFVYFMDEGISGKSSENRDAFLEMLDIIQNQDKDDPNYIEGICCFNLSRLSRSLKLTMEIFDLLKANTLKLYTVDKSFKGNLTSGESMITASIFGMLNELYLINLRETVIPSMRESADKGFTQGGMPPLGYDYLKVQDNGGSYRDVYVINENEAEIVRRIFNAYVTEKKSLYTITKELNEEGYKTKTYKNRRGTNFSTTTVTNILANAVYIGKVIWGKTQTTTLQKVKGVRQKKIRIFSEEEIRNASGNHTAIIEADIFFKARERMNERKQPRKNLNMARKRKGVQQKSYFEENRRIFSNVLRCPECGSRMTSSPHYKRDSEGNIIDTKYSYICTAYNAGKSNCKGYYRVSEQHVYELIRHDFISRLENQYKLVKIYLDYKIETDEEKLKYLEEVNPEKAKRLERLKENQKKHIKDLDAIVQLTIEHKDNKRMQEIYLKKSKELDKKLDSSEEKITQLINEIEQEKEQKRVLLSNMQETENEDSFESYFSNLNMDKQRKLIEQVYHTIIIDTEAKRSGKQKQSKLKSTKLNDDFSIRRISEILGIDFKEFYNKLNEKGIQLPEITKYFSDAGDFARTLVDLYKEDGVKAKKAEDIIDAYINDINEKYKEQTLEEQNQEKEIVILKDLLLDENQKKELMALETIKINEELELDIQISELREKIRNLSSTKKDKKLIGILKEDLTQLVKRRMNLILGDVAIS